MAKATKKRKPPALRTDGIDRLDNDELRAALIEKLSVAELNALDKQIRQTVEKACLQIAKESTEEAYKRQFAVTFRVLRDRFGFGRDRLCRMWDLCLEYINDIDQGLLSTKEMLDTLQREDGIKIDWRVDI
jgi:hypothetical protein